jgi:hypothetical protein
VNLNVIARRHLACLVAAPLLALTAGPALAVDQVHDEIQVYNADINDVGQWSYEQHLNFGYRSEAAGVSGRIYVEPQSARHPGIRLWHHQLVGGRLLLAVWGHWQRRISLKRGQAPQPVCGAGRRQAQFLLRRQFRVELRDAAIRADAWNMEIRSIIGVRNKEWEFIVNPIVDIGFGPGGEADFAPAARLARNLGEDRFIGLEYYSDYGKIGNILPLPQQSQQLYAVTDFKVKDVDVQLGGGYGFTPGSDRLIFKAIIGYAFPVPGKNNDAGGASSSMTMGTQPRAAQNPFPGK